MTKSVLSFLESRASRCLRLLALLVCIASGATGALAQVVLSPSRIEWASYSTSGEPVHVNATGPWTADIYPQGHFVVDSEEGEDSDFIHVRPVCAVSGSAYVYATLTVRDEGGRFAAVQLLHEGAPLPPDPPAPQDSTERIDLGGNWILHRTYTSSDGSTSYEDLTFYDGLGYAMQTVKVGASPDGGRNIVTPIVYDALRRSDARTYLPYVSASVGRAAVPSADVLAAQASWYESRYPGGGSYAYGEKVYEASPLDRAVAAHRAGADYAREGGNRGVAVSRSLCAAGEVRLLLVGPSGELTVSGHYPAGSLMRTRTTDEDGSESVVWTDNFGRAVLERRLCDGQTLDTYHVYDAFGREAWTVSPEGSAALPSSGSWAVPQAGDANAAPAARYCTVRTYDAAGNVLSRKLPGRETEEYVYDAAGRLRMRRDGLSRNAGKWFTYTYDHGGRLTETRLLTSSADAEHFRSLFASGGAFPPLEVYPRSATLLVRSGYGSYVSAGADLGFVPVPGVAETADLVRTAGLLTYEKVAELAPGSYGSVSGYVERAHYYDESGREIQTVEKDASGAVSRHSFGLDFSGNVTGEVEEHPGGSKRTSFTYDARGRRLSETVSLNSGAAAQVAYSYDGLGRPAGMTMGGGSSSGTSVVQTDAYDMQGRMSSRAASLGGTPLFSMSLRYGAPSRGTSPRWSGGISEWEWRQGTGTPHTYAFSYDGVGRLTDTRRYAGTGTTAQNARSERGMSYDRNGNLKTLQRYGESGGTPELSLSYSYEGNRRAGMAYDANGNLLTTPEAAGTAVEYNLLNLPSAVREGGAVRSRHVYLADGTKVSSTDGSAGVHRYRGSFVYGADGTLESVGFSAGRIHGGGVSQGDVRYYVLDHLGSVRAVVDGAGTVHERNDYYPYGEHYGVAAASAADRWRFSGKEDLSSVGGLRALDFGARLYSPGSVTWLTQDPAAESYPWLSPYSYCAGDPVRFMDSTGEAIETPWDALNVSIGIVSLAANIREGNFFGAVLDAAALAYDVFATATPFVPGGASMAIKAARAGSKGAATVAAASAGRVVAHHVVESAAESAAKTAVQATVKATAKSAARRFKLADKFKYYNEFGIGSYNALRKSVLSTFGKGSELQVHHIVEQRFAKALGIQNTGKMPSIVVTRDEHQVLTNAWRKAIPYLKDYKAVSIDDVRRAAAEVYADLPEMMEYVEQTLLMATIH